MSFWKRLFGGSEAGPAQSQAATGATGTSELAVKQEKIRATTRPNDIRQFIWMMNRTLPLGEGALLETFADVYREINPKLFTVLQQAGLWGNVRLKIMVAPTEQHADPGLLFKVAQESDGNRVFWQGATSRLRIGGNMLEVSYKIFTVAHDHTIVGRERQVILLDGVLLPDG